MLINSVVLLLRDALPVLLFISILSAIIDRDTESVRWVYKAMLAGLLGMIAVSWSINIVSEWAEGFGFELLTALFHIVTYAAAIMFIFVGTVQRRILLATIATALLVSIHGANLQIYFSGFWSDPGARDALLVGSVLGLGITLSLACLTFFALRSVLIEQWPKLPFIVLALVAARQITEAVYFLIQADCLPTAQPLWNTSKYLSDSSEFGHLFNALTGYEASPTLTQVVVHFIALLIPVILILKKRFNSTSVTEATS